MAEDRLRRHFDCYLGKTEIVIYTILAAPLRARIERVAGSLKLAYSALVQHFTDEVRALSERISHFRKLVINVRFDLATKVSTDASSTNPRTGMESGMRSNGLTK